MAGSVVYMGRGSFRMEAVFSDAEAFEPGDVFHGAYEDDGAPREVTGIVTSPYGARPSNDVHNDVDEDATALIDRARTGAWRAPEPDALFGSQDEMPMLAAPSGRTYARRRRVSLSRGALVASGMLLFACGLASGAVARRATMTHARPAAAVTVAQKAAAPVVVEAPPSFEAPVARTPDVQVIPVPEPVVIHAHKKTAAVAAEAHVEPASKPAAARWVDPFAD
ncbi:MAG TPA: hypothetical protein VHJ20_14380 [Polyangia bacterium]|nr:hypothetical protein [Polyangia bacterium]